MCDGLPFQVLQSNQLSLLYILHFHVVVLKSFVHTLSSLILTTVQTKTVS